MATEYYDHPLEVDPQTGKGFLKRPPAMTERTSVALRAHHGRVDDSSLGKAWGVFPYGKRDTEVSKALLALQYSLGYVLMTSITVGRHWAVVRLPRKPAVEVLAQALRNVSSILSC